MPLPWSQGALQRNSFTSPFPFGGWQIGLGFGSAKFWYNNGVRPGLGTLVVAQQKRVTRCKVFWKVFYRAEKVVLLPVPPTHSLTHSEATSAGKGRDAYLLLLHVLPVCLFVDGDRTGKAFLLPHFVCQHAGLEAITIRTYAVHLSQTPPTPFFFYCRFYDAVCLPSRSYPECYFPLDSSGRTDLCIPLGSSYICNVILHS